MRRAGTMADKSSRRPAHPKNQHYKKRKSLQRADERELIPTDPVDFVNGSRHVHKAKCPQNLSRRRYSHMENAEPTLAGF